MSTFVLGCNFTFQLTSRRLLLCFVGCRLVGLCSCFSCSAKTRVRTRFPSRKVGKELFPVVDRLQEAGSSFKKLESWRGLTALPVRELCAGQDGDWGIAEAAEGRHGKRTQPSPRILRADLDCTLGIQTSFEVQSPRCPPGPAAYVVPTCFMLNLIPKTHPCDSGLQLRLVRPHTKAASPVPPLETRRGTAAEPARAHAGATKGSSETERARGIAAMVLRAAGHDAGLGAAGHGKWRGVWHVLLLLPPG